MPLLSPALYGPAYATGFWLARPLTFLIVEGVGYSWRNARVLGPWPYVN